MKAQAATEYVIIIAVILAALIPIFIYAFQESNRTTRINQASDTVNTLVRKAESVYALGPGSRDYVWVAVPSGIESSLVDNGTVSLHFSDLGDAAAFTNINITGTIPIDQGIYRISVEMLENVVVIGPVNDTEPPEITDTSPEGIVRISNPTLTATTNEAATCRYDDADADYESMSNAMSGSGLRHTSQLSGLTNGDYTYYVRCIDLFENVMESSAVTTFTVVLDTADPVVSNTAVNDTSLNVNQYICINATVTDNGVIDYVWAFLTTPLDSPLPDQLNYTMSDTAACAGGAGDDIYGVVIEMQAPGDWYINTTFANDTADNLGYEDPYPNIYVNVSPESGDPAGIFEYLPVDVGLYYVSPSGGWNASDSDLSTTNYWIALTDEDLQTPPSTARFRYRQAQSIYEGFIVQLNVSKDTYAAYSLRLKLRDIDVNPYNLTIYAYQNNTHITTANAVSFSLTHEVISGEDRGFNEITVTDTVMAGNSTYVRLRIVPHTSMGGNSAYPKEADIGVTRS